MTCQGGALVVLLVLMEEACLVVREGRCEDDPELRDFRFFLPSPPGLLFLRDPPPTPPLVEAYKIFVVNLLLLVVVVVVPNNDACATCFCCETRNRQYLVRGYENEKL